MTFIYRFFQASIILSVFVQSLVFAQDLVFPEPKGFVNDFSNVLSQQEESALEQTLRNFERETGNEIVIAVVPDLQETTVEDYSVRLFEKWGIGKKGQDNGILFLVSTGDRKVRLEVGYGLEGVLPDGLAGQILDQKTLPHFRAGNFREGIFETVAAVIPIIEKDYEISQKFLETAEPVRSIPVGYYFYLIFFIFPIFISWLSSFLGRSKRIWPGGVLGVLTGALVSFFIFGTLFVVLGAALFFGLIGLLFDYIVSKNYAIRKAKGLPTDFRHSGGGFWFFGGPFGGGRGGGFGGFGGGFGGGGGASRGF